MKNISVTYDAKINTPYVDKKKWLWMLSMLYPLEGLLGIFLHYKTANEYWLLLPLIIAYCISPIADWVIGEDKNNPPDTAISELDNVKYYRILTYLVIPIHYVALIILAWWAGTQNLSWWAFIAVAISAGLGSGLGINTGHELGHKKSQLERNLAKLVLAVPAYGHFSIEHNRGHHAHVSTPEDPASSRMGESIYRFALREIPSAFKRAIIIEKNRLNRRGKVFWTTNNQILQSMAITVTLQALLIILFGWIMIPFLILHNFFAWWQLTSANYVEHYGLLRKKNSDGKYEHCKPHHSWNSNHIFSNLVLFQLERHSDHHAHPIRRYQSLKHYPSLPTLPTGYFGCYVMAYIPWIWFTIMDKRLLKLPSINGDLSKINIDPKKRRKYYELFSSLK